MFMPCLEYLCVEGGAGSWESLLQGFSLTDDTCNYILQISSNEGSCLELLPDLDQLIHAFGILT